MAKKLVGHFKHSALATSALKQHQVQMNLPERKLKQDVPTRWNSTYYMLQRLLEMRWPVVAVLSDESVIKRSDRHLDLQSDQSCFRSCECLEPLEIATVFLSYEYNTSISCIYPILFGLIETMKESEDDSPVCSQLKNKIVSSVQSRWSLNSLDPCGVTTIATALDPCFRNLKFLTESQKNSIKYYLKEKVEHLQSLQQQDEDSQRVTSPSPPKKTALDKLLGYEELELSSDHDVDSYFAEKVVSRSTNTLEWWKENKSRFPFVAELARSFLCVPGTSSVRVFS